ncbi:hypothetical protein VU04_09250 [Desulfobulbus sp. TB]|nr:hypothetical protein [Desulfobulbus sp. TB]
MKFGNLITSSANKGSSEKFDKVTLDDNLLIFESITIQIQNISRLTSYIIKRTCKYRLSMILINSYLQYILFFILKYPDAPFIPTPFFPIYTESKVYFFIIYIIFLALLMDALFYKRYGVQIQTDGGTVDQIITSDKESANELLIRLIVLIKNYNKHELSEAITLYKDCKISNDHILGDKFSDIENSFIKNRSKNDEE